ncbi:hypothetical protein Y886_08470 [Xanthomonas hyacinthi DSM 19077]|nr:hypothetical protein Y886_08470 [Xanthomonas hyacinthi DSM 19077]
MSEDYYSGGQMMWLDVDAKLRSLTKDKHSLDDFAQAFFGVENGSYVPKTYTFDDVVAALNGVAPFDWASFIKARATSLNPPLQDGLAASGWKLVYDDKESEFETQSDSRPESSRHMLNFTWSIGLTLTSSGKVNDVRWDGPAFKAGVSTGATVIAVNGTVYSKDAMTSAITAAKDSKTPIDLTVKYQGRIRTIPVDYHGGLQYPHLVRIAGTPDYLSEIIAPRK